MANKILSSALILLLLSITTVSFTQKNKNMETFTDSRDGQVYKTIKIGNQIWMAENLAYKTERGCWAYDNDKTKVAEYGYLYDWKTAKASCPKGWHLPSDEEWTELINYLGGKELAGEKLKSSNWNLFDGKNYGNNSSGFSTLPNGFCIDHGRGMMIFGGLGEDGNLWSSTTNGSDASYYKLDADRSSIGQDNIDHSSGLAVRCIKEN